MASAKVTTADVADVLRAIVGSLRQTPGQIVGSISSVGFVAGNTGPGSIGYVNRGGGSFVNAPQINVGASGSSETAIVEGLDRLLAVLDDDPDEGRVRAVWTSVVAQLPPFIIAASAQMLAMAGYAHLPH